MTRVAGGMFMLSLSTLGVVLSVYGSILNPSGSLGEWWPLLKNDLGARKVDLTRVMSSSPSVGGQSSADLYVFALDVSGSMADGKIAGSEFQELRRRFEENGLAISPECQPSAPLTRWELGRAEICTLLEQVPTGAYASLWKFAASPTPMSDGTLRFDVDLKTRRIPELATFRAKLASPEFRPDPADQDFQNTDFEALLNALYDTYVRSDDDWREIHFFIVSDFKHEVGNKKAYDFSVERIADKFSNIGKVGNTMFHLDVIGDADHEVSSMVRVAESTVEWFQCRVHNIQGRKTARDFFNTFVPSNESLPFYYVNSTSGVSPIMLLAGDQKFQGAEVVLGLMRDLNRGSSPDLTMQVSTAWNGIPCIPPTRNVGLRRQTPTEEVLRPEILRPGMNRVVRIERPNDYICLQPLSPIDDDASYRLTIAKVGDPKDHRTYTADIQFQRVIPRFASYTILFSTMLLTVSGAAFTGGVLGALLSRRKR